jgi:hypothetical protein
VGVDQPCSSHHTPGTGVEVQGWPKVAVGQEGCLLTLERKGLKEEVL